MMPLVKFCGLRRSHEIRLASRLKVTFIGLVFVKKSPRFVDRTLAFALNREAQRRGLMTVGVCSDPSLDYLTCLLDDIPLDFLQLHGKETPDFCKQATALTQHYNSGIIKAYPVETSHDLEHARLYEDTCSFLLLDAKPPEKASHLGGHGKAFNWKILSDFKPAVPFFLAGGLQTNNLHQVGKRSIFALDVSSGIEYPKGSARAYQKSAHRMTRFMQKLKKLF